MCVCVCVCVTEVRLLVLLSRSENNVTFLGNDIPTRRFFKGVILLASFSSSTDSEGHSHGSVDSLLSDCLSWLRIWKLRRDWKRRGRVSKGAKFEEFWEADELFVFCPSFEEYKGWSKQNLRNRETYDLIDQLLRSTYFCVPSFNFAFKID